MSETIKNILDGETRGFPAGPSPSSLMLPRPAHFVMIRCYCSAGCCASFKALTHVLLLNKCVLDGRD